jgi:hypothetical protein
MATTSFTLVGNSADSRGFADVTPCIATPNATLHLPPEAGARDERRLEAVRCKRVLGAVWAKGTTPARGLLLLVVPAFRALRADGYDGPRFVRHSSSTLRQEL